MKGKRNFKNKNGRRIAKARQSRWQGCSDKWRNKANKIRKWGETSFRMIHYCVFSRIDYWEDIGDDITTKRKVFKKKILKNYFQIMQRLKIFTSYAPEYKVHYTKYLNFYYGMETMEWSVINVKFKLNFLLNWLINFPYGLI